MLICDNHAAASASSMSKDTSRETVSTCQHICKLPITRHEKECLIRTNALIFV
jgi:hypothetical protein